MRVAVSAQMAFIPAQYAAAYFGEDDTHLNSRGASHLRSYVPVVIGFGAGQWPEGAVTRRLLEAGARLEVLDIEATLVYEALPPSGLDTAAIYDISKICRSAIAGGDVRRWK